MFLIFHQEHKSLKFNGSKLLQVCFYREIQLVNRNLKMQNNWNYSVKGGHLENIKT